MPTPNTSPVFPVSYNVGVAVISAANTNRDGSAGTLVTLVTAASQGTRVDRIVITATGTTTAGMVRAYLNSSATNYLLKETTVSAIVPSGTVAAFTAEIVRSDGLPLAELVSGQLLKLTTHNAETFHCVAFGGDL